MEPRGLRRQTGQTNQVLVDASIPSALAMPSSFTALIGPVNPPVVAGMRRRLAPRPLSIL